MPLTIEEPKKRVEELTELPKYPVGTFVTIEYFETPQHRTPKKLNGVVISVSSVGGNGWNKFFYSIQPEGFRKVVSDVPEEDVYPAQKYTEKRK